MVCQSRGTIADIECAVGTAPCLDPDIARGSGVDQAEVTLWGLCPPCRTRRTIDA